MINENVPAINIRNLLDNMSKKLGRNIPKEVESLLSDFGAGGKPIITTVLPDPVPAKITGIVKKSDPINIYKRLQISSNEINRKVLGRFSLPLLNVVVQEKPENHQRCINQWEFLIPCDDIDNCGFKLGLKVDAELEACTIYEDEVFWVCSCIDWD
jgi:hypothetical protein